MTPEKRIWQELCNRVSWVGHSEMVKNKLREYSGSILKENGRLIIRAIENNDAETYKELIKYFDKKELSDLDRDSDEFKNLVLKMREVIDYAIEDEDLTDAMKEALGLPLKEKIFKYIE